MNENKARFEALVDRMRSELRYMQPPPPPVHSSGVRYLRDPISAVSVNFDAPRTISYMLQRMAGDAEELAAWRMAEIRESNEKLPLEARTTVLPVFVTLPGHVEPSTLMLEFRDADGVTWREDFIGKVVARKDEK